MNLRKGFARFAAAMALFAIVTSIGLISGSTTNAQAAPPHLVYGVGLTSGDVVAVSINGVDCGSTTANADGEWVMSINGATCNALEGDTIGFTLNGEAVTETASYKSGGTPISGGYPAATGIPMTVGMADMGDAPAADDGDAAPAPADTGSAGLVAEGNTSLWFVMALGALALATLAGGRVVTGRELR